MDSVRFGDDRDTRTIADPRGARCDEGTNRAEDGPGRCDSTGVAILMPMRSLLVALGACLLSAPSAAQQDPPRRLEFDSTATAPRRQTERTIGNAFVRDQTVLGALLYAPAFAIALGDDGLTSAAAYLVVAGGTFFASAELTRRLEITEARRDLAFALPLRGGGTALLLGHATGLEREQQGAVVFLGSVGGMAGGLILGRNLSPGEGAATVFGHDLGFLSGVAISVIALGDEGNAIFDVEDRAGRVALWTGTGVAGLILGRRYAANARHNVTAGDVQTLWLGTTIGALAATTVIVQSDPGAQGTAGALLVGGLAGTWVAERFLVRVYDHTRSEGNLLSLGAAAGGVMGVGLGVLFGGELQRGTALTLGLATVGAMGGVALTERYLQPVGDGGKRTGDAGRFRLDPLAGIAAAARTPGRHTLVSFTF
jgi:hypothetical protein